MYGVAAVDTIDVRQVRFERLVGSYMIRTMPDLRSHLPLSDASCRGEA